MDNRTSTVAWCLLALSRPRTERDCFTVYVRVGTPHRCRDQTGLDAINNSFLAWVAYKLGSFVPISTLKIYIFRSKIQEDYSSYSRWGIKGEPVGRVSKCHQYTRKSSHGSHVPGLLGNHYKINLLVMNVSTFRSIRAETIGMNKSYHAKKTQRVRRSDRPAFQCKIRKQLIL